MKKPSLDRAFRVIWLIVGGLLLLILLIGGGMIVAQWLGNRGAGEQAVRVARESAQAPREQPRAVRYGAPRPIRGTATRLVTVEYGREFEPNAGGSASGDRSSAEVVANVIFLDAQGARLLLDQPAYIRHIALPGTPDAGDPEQRWIGYQIALEDTNGDGQLNFRDEQRLYATDLEGRNLRPVLPRPLKHVRHAALDAGRMLVYALGPPAGPPVPEDQWRQRAFIYDVASGQLAAYSALESAAARAGQILAR